MLQQENNKTLVSDTLVNQSPQSQLQLPNATVSASMSMKNDTANVNVNTEPATVDEIWPAYKLPVDAQAEEAARWMRSQGSMGGQAGTLLSPAPADILGGAPSAGGASQAQSADLVKFIAEAKRAGLSVDEARQRWQARMQAMPTPSVTPNPVPTPPGY